MNKKKHKEKHSMKMSINRQKAHYSNFFKTSKNIKKNCWLETTF